jgi:hypothetical protein
VFTDIDGSNHLTVTITPTADSMAVITGNSDLWTANSGLNPGHPASSSAAARSAPAEIVGWKESGGFALHLLTERGGDPAVVPMTASTGYTVKLNGKPTRPPQGIDLRGRRAHRG